MIVTATFSVMACLFLNKLLVPVIHLLVVGILFNVTVYVLNYILHVISSILRMKKIVHMKNGRSKVQL
jgi:hypothetical protein